MPQGEKPRSGCLPGGGTGSKRKFERYGGRGAGMHARVSEYRLGDASREDAVRAFEGSRDAVEHMEGNEGGLLLVDAGGGRAITITFWDGAESLQKTEQQANQVRQQAASASGLTVERVAAYEVGLGFGRWAAAATSA